MLCLSVKLLSAIICPFELSISILKPLANHQKKHLRSLLPDLQAVSDLGLSVYQYRAFLLCVEAEGSGLPMSDIAGLGDSTTDLKAYMSFKIAVTRLMDGERSRSGLHLLAWGGQAWSAPSIVQRRSRTVLVTTKAQKLVSATVPAQSMIKVLEAAKVSGISSTHQLAMFIICALNVGELLPDTFEKELGGIKPSDTAYKRAYGAVRKLMCGYRRSDGLHLLKFGEPVYYKCSTPRNLLSKHLQVTDAGWDLLWRLCKTSKSV